MTMGASNQHDDAFRKEVGTQGVDFTGDGWSQAKLLLSAEGGRPPPTEDKRIAETISLGGDTPARTAMTNH
jgi:hypothetical protein